jgi:hypothetical protein
MEVLLIDEAETHRVVGARQPTIKWPLDIQVHYAYRNIPLSDLQLWTGSSLVEPLAYRSFRSFKIKLTLQQCLSSLVL